MPNEALVDERGFFGDRRTMRRPVVVAGFCVPATGLVLLDPTLPMKTNFGGSKWASFVARGGSENDARLNTGASILSGDGSTLDACYTVNICIFVELNL